MNDDQALRVLDVMTAAWPNQDLPDKTVDLWVGMLAGLEFDDAKQAALQIVREDHWFPSIARFTQVAKAHARRREIRLSEHRGLPADSRWPEPPGELLDAARQLIDKRQTMPAHNHHGPDPCLVCGGIDPPRHRAPERPGGRQ